MHIFRTHVLISSVTPLSTEEIQGLQIGVPSLLRTSVSEVTITPEISALLGEGTQDRGAAKLAAFRGMRDLKARQ